MVNLLVRSGEHADREWCFVQVGQWYKLHKLAQQKLVSSVAIVLGLELLRPVLSDYRASW
jgi:hypothetical protein